MKPPAWFRYQFLLGEYSEEECLARAEQMLSKLDQIWLELTPKEQNTMDELVEELREY